MGTHRTGTPVVEIRWRLHLERHLPPGVEPNERNMQLYYGFGAAR